MILYHGTSEKTVVPTYGLGNDKHDYGRGFYLTEDIELAKEWAVCKPNNNGWVHKYELDIESLQILDFQNKNILANSFLYLDGLRFAFSNASLSQRLADLLSLACIGTSCALSQ